MPNGLAAISKVPAAGWGQILAYMAFCEVSQDQSAGTPAAAGDFGFKVLTSSDPAEKTKKLNAELANGRLAMMAIIGMFFQALFSEVVDLVFIGFSRFLWSVGFTTLNDYFIFCCEFNYSCCRMTLNNYSILFMLLQLQSCSCGSSFMIEQSLPHS